MRMPFWNCEIQKNWDGTLREEMLSRNIVCYGKPGSGKTEKVVKPFLRHAIESGRSILFLTRQEDEVYEDIFDLALEHDYEVWDDDPMYLSEFSRDDITRHAVEMLTDMLSAPTMYCLRLENKGRWENNTAQYVIRSIASASRRGMFREEHCRLSLVIDDADWEVTVPGEVRRSSWLNFCITMDNMRLTQADLVSKRCIELRANLQEAHDQQDNGTFAALVQGMNAAVTNGDHNAVVSILNEKVDMDAFSNKFHPLLLSSNDSLLASQMQDAPEHMVRSFAYYVTPQSVRDFFEDVQTVICTGVAGISPDTHRSFQEACILPTGMRALGGKYLVTDLCTPLQGISKSVFPKTVMTWGKNTPVENVFRNDFVPGHCVVEQNGAVKMYAAYHGGLIPVVFPTVSQALAWLDMYFTQQGWGSPEAVEVDHCSLRYLLPTVNERGEQDEIVISYIQKEDVDAYVEQALMLSMEVEEYLTHPELMAEVPDLALKKEPANVSLQKIASYACRNYRRVRKVATSQELPVDESTNQAAASMIEEYKWRPYQKPVSTDEVRETPQQTAMDILPEKRVLFLGGHANMVKKLRQRFPSWEFLTDDELGSWTGSDCDVIFFWSNHCSHLIYEYVNARKNKNTPYLYVTATNINRLINEMADLYKSYLTKQAVGAC